MLRLAVITAGLLILMSCTREDPRLASLVATESSTVTGAERIRELESVVEEYGQIVSEKVDAAMRQASYLRLLSVEYMRQELYGPALKSLEEAIQIEPQNPILHYYAGVSAGHLAKAQARPEARSNFLGMAERSYLRAIELDPTYHDALYAVSVLYVFELNQPERAIPHLTALLDRSPGNSSALFLVARAHAALGSVDEALAAYDRIIETATDTEIKEAARRNRRLLTGEGL